MLHALASSLRARLAALALVLLFPGALPLAAQNAPQGPPAPAPKSEAQIVRSIEVQGAKRYTREQLVQALGQELGVPYDVERVNRGINTLWTAFKVRADVQMRARPDGVDLLLLVTEELVDREPRFAGNRDIDLETLLRWAHLEDKGELFLYQSKRVRQRLLEGYHQEGYPFVEIEVQEHGLDGAAGELPDVIFEIREGPQVRVKAIEIRGNRSLPETGALWWKNGLLHLADTELEGPWLFNMRGSKFVEETLQSDLIALRNVYRDLGWLDAVVELDPPLEFTPDRSHVTIHIRVDEGEPYVVSKLSIRGVTRELGAGKRSLDEATETEAPLIFPQEKLLSLCKLAAGQPYQRAKQQLDSAAIRKYYGERGYLSNSGNNGLGTLDSFVFLEPELIFDQQGHKVEVVYKLQQGIRRWIREVLFQGSEFTRDRVLRREVDVLPGEIANAEEINRSLSRLFQTDYFSGNPTDLEHREPAYRFLPQSDPKWVDLVYTVQEGRVVDFMLNGGVDSNNGLVARLSLQMRNFDARNPPSSVWSVFSELYEKQAFHGAGQTLQLDFSPGTQTNQARIRFVEPDLFGTQFNRYILDTELSASRRHWDFYQEDRQRMSLRIGREFGRDLVLTAGITGQLITVSDIEVPLSGMHPPDEPTVPPALTAQAGETALNGLTLDMRYAHVDNRINPYEGYNVAWRNALYGGMLAGDWNFLRSQIDIDGYFILGARTEDQAQPGFHVSLGAGIADPYGDSTLVPYTERFFLGGLNTLRGFSNRGVGPNTGNEPNGGETMAAGSLEYRIPLSTQTEPGTYREREVFRFLLFADAGVLSDTPYQLDANELRTSVGFGIGMAYPLPINLYFGFPMKQGPGDERQTFGFNVSAFGF